MSEGEAGQPPQTPPDFSGKWNHVRSENFSEFLAANGANWMIRQMATRSNPTLEVTQEGNKFTLKLISMVMTKESAFTVGETFEEKVHSGDIMLGTPSWDGDKLVVEMKPKDEKSSIKPQKQTRHIEDGHIVLTLEVDDVVAKRYFKKDQ